MSVMNLLSEREREKTVFELTSTAKIVDVEACTTTA